MIKISVIIPVYNVEKYLRQCLDSVINQTYKNLEIICIDDCSTDNSFQILKEYEKIDDRIKIYKNDQNIKAGLTRNRGLELATGEYIHFLDSDDWLEPDAYKNTEIYLKKSIDVIQFLLNYFKENKFEPDNVQIADEHKIYNLKKNNEILKCWSWHLCNRLYSKKFLLENNLLFKNTPCFEDTLFSLKTLTYAKTICFCNKWSYNYRKDNETSLMANYDKYIDYMLEYFNDSLLLCKDMSNELRDNFLVWVYCNIFFLVFSLYENKKLTYKKLKIFLSKFNYNLFNKENLKHGYFVYSKEIVKYSENYFLLKNFLRKYIKKFLPILYNLIISTKRI